jgi:hypothetical protein
MRLVPLLILALASLVDSAGGQTYLDLKHPTNVRGQCTYPCGTFELLPVLVSWQGSLQQAWILNRYSGEIWFCRDLDLQYMKGIESGCVSINSSINHPIEQYQQPVFQIAPLTMTFGISSKKEESSSLASLAIGFMLFNTADGAIKYCSLLTKPAMPTQADIPPLSCRTIPSPPSFKLPLPPP